MWQNPQAKIIILCNISILTFNCCFASSVLKNAVATKRKTFWDTEVCKVFSRLHTSNLPKVVCIRSVLWLLVNWDSPLCSVDGAALRMCILKDADPELGTAQIQETTTCTLVDVLFFPIVLFVWNRPDYYSNASAESLNVALLNKGLANHKGVSSSKAEPQMKCGWESVSTGWARGTHTF